jgi:hypothetical protein
MRELKGIPRRWLPWVALLMASGCGMFGAGRDSAAKDVAPVLAKPESLSAYVPKDTVATGWGSLSVAVTVADDSLRDTTIFPIRDFDACGAQLSDNSVQRNGRSLSQAVVWISNLNEGKAMPARKRFDIAQKGCLLSPRILAVTVGGTLNVRNMDSALHVLKFTDTRTGEVLARITQSEPGQVVPIDYMFDAARVIEVSCETHPWTKAWIQVFDRPYFAITDVSGSAVMDSIPAGSYQLVVWHERLGEQRTEVVVAPGVRQSVGVELGRAAGAGKRD